jgi:histidinol-phosphate aminotransferase
MASYALPQCLRITIGTAEECGMVLDALTGFARSAGPDA